jgi:hypothetical protein
MRHSELPNEPAGLALNHSECPRRTLPGFRSRLLISVGCGVLAGLRTYLISDTAARPRDFGQIWYAARALLSGADPYALIGPGRQFDWPAPFFYPLTAGVVALPLAPLPATWAPVVFTTIACACFAWALMEHGYAPLLGFLSAAVVFAAELAQWSPLLAAATVITPLSVIYVAKPTIGAAMFAARPSLWAITGGLALMGVSFALQPHWLSGWRTALAQQSIPLVDVYPYVAPVTSWGGAIAIMCVLRWRRPEARLVAALACVPQTPMLYETVPLFLVPRTAVESGALVVFSFVAMTLGAVGAHSDPATSARTWNLALLMLYAPATIMVLRRPNSGALPQWLENRIPALWPNWLRGSAHSTGPNR